MEAPLDGRAPAELLQDGPHVVQVAGGGQPRGERDALRGGGAASPHGVPGPGLAPRWGCGS